MAEIYKPSIGDLGWVWNGHSIIPEVAALHWLLYCRLSVDPLVPLNLITLPHSPFSCPLLRSAASCETPCPPVTTTELPWAMFCLSPHLLSVMLSLFSHSLPILPSIRKQICPISSCSVWPPSQLPALTTAPPPSPRLWLSQVAFPWTTARIEGWPGCWLDFFWPRFYDGRQNWKLLLFLSRWSTWRKWGQWLSSWCSRKSSRSLCGSGWRWCRWVCRPRNGRSLWEIWFWAERKGSLGAARAPHGKSPWRNLLGARIGRNGSWGDPVGRPAPAHEAISRETVLPSAAAAMLFFYSYDAIITK